MAEADIQPAVNGVDHGEADTLEIRGQSREETSSQETPPLTQVNGETGEEQETEEETKKKRQNSVLEGWIRIQATTFTNWINDKIRDSGLFVNELTEDLKDGVVLCKVMESVKGKRIGRIIMKKNLGHIEASGNLALALETMKGDGIKLVNIGAEDIANGNIKLILGMLWMLVRRYQMGSQARSPPKKSMLLWINAVLHPHKVVENFTTDWNDGIALQGIIEYCQPGTFPSWMSKDTSEKTYNCREGIETGQRLFEIPALITAENMASRHLDELSTLTYLSYYMQKNGPGYRATLNWVKDQIPSVKVDNFDRDWNNGYVLSELVQALGGQILGWPSFDTSNWLGTINNAMDASRDQLRVRQVITSKEIMNSESEHIPVMAYAAWHRHHSQEAQPPPRSITPPPPMFIPPPPAATPPPPSFTPPPPPVENVIVTIANQNVEEPPPDEAGEELTMETPEPDIPRVICPTKVPINKLTSITVNTVDVGKCTVSCSARSPDGTARNLHVSRLSEHLHTLHFQPHIVGNWQLLIGYNDGTLNKDLKFPGGLFTPLVFDASKVTLEKVQQEVIVNTMYSFKVNTKSSGLEDITAYVLFDGESVETKITPAEEDLYEVSFKPAEPGLHTVCVYCGGINVHGSPFTVTSTILDGVEASGPGLSSGVIGQPTFFTLDFSKKSGGRISVEAFSPKQEKVDLDVENVSKGIIKCTYTPAVEGEHLMIVNYNDVPFPGSPFHVNVIEDADVVVNNLVETAYVGEESIFEIDAAKAGKGKLEIDSELKFLKYDKVRDRVFHVTFEAKKEGDHDLNIKYNGKMVKGCPFHVNVIQKPTDENQNAMANGSVH